MEGRHGSLRAAKEGKVARGAHAHSNIHNHTDCPGKVVAHLADLRGQVRGRKAEIEDSGA
jgi:hypothetical protein